jgi:hypothetical protein
VNRRERSHSDRHKEKGTRETAALSIAAVLLLEMAHSSGSKPELIFYNARSGGFTVYGKAAKKTRS